MTVCIAALSEPEIHEQYIVTASDRMVSMGGYLSGDNVIRKIDPVGYRWTSMIAGNDISPSVPILDRIHLHSKSKKHHESLASMVEAFKSAYKAERLEMIEDSLLNRLGFTWDSFRSNAKTILSELDYDRIINQIKNFELEITFLVAGFDANNEGHIFAVENPGRCSFYEKIGFWAIGSGQQQAIASMFSSRYHRHASLEDCVARVLCAKLAAESAIGVGKDTWLLVDSNQGWERSLHIPRRTIGEFRMLWDALPKVPEAGIDAIKREIASGVSQVLEEVAEVEEIVSEPSE